MIDRYIENGALKIHILEWKPDDIGAPIILLHGLASNAHIWDLVSPKFLQHDLRPIAWDARGHGLSEKPEDGYDFKTITEDLHTLIVGMNTNRPILVGHSWGGHLAINYAAQYGTGRYSPSALVLVDGGITQLNDSPDTSWETTRDRLTPPRLAGMPLDEFLAQIKNWHQYWQPGEKEMEIIMHNINIYDDPSSARILIAPYLSFDRHMQIVRALWDYPTYEYFKDLRCPVLAIIAKPPGPLSKGEAIFLNAKIRGLSIAQECIPTLQVHWMENTIHDIPLQKPGELSRIIIDYIQSLKL